MVVPLVEYTDDDKEYDIEVDSFDANWVRCVIGDTDVTLISGLPMLYATELEEYRFLAAYGLRFNERLQTHLKDTLDHIGALQASSKKKEELLLASSSKKEEELQQLHEAQVDSLEEARKEIKELQAKLDGGQAPRSNVMS
ncbi:unnamed protein product [Calypogeia fissa]